MAFYYSNAERGFFDTSFFNYVLPEDAVELTQQEYDDIFEGFAVGKTLLFDEHTRKPYVEFVPVVKTRAQIEQTFTNAMNNVCESQALSLRYRSMMEAISYVGDPNPVYAREAFALRAWRSDVETTAYAALAQFETDSIENLAVFLAALPKFDLDKYAPATSDGA